MAVELGLKDPPEFTQDAMNTLLSYSWPGNIRELKNAVERSVFRLNGGLIDQVFLDPFASPYRVSPPEKPTDLEGKMDLNKQLADTERRWILEALTRNRYHQRKTAESLSLSYHQFRNTH